MPYCNQVNVQQGSFTFEIFDHPTYQDGICCTYGQGAYSLYTGKTMAKAGGDFGFSESTTFTVGGGGPTDNCPDDPNKTDPGVCGCGVSDVDSDNDNTPDCNDSCPDDPSKVSPGQCGCGVADVDTDGDGFLDCNDSCPDDPNKTTDAGVCGCGVEDIDSDGDGVFDCNDGCPNDNAKTSPGQCGCGVAEGSCGTQWPIINGFENGSGGCSWNGWTDGGANADLITNSKNVISGCALRLQDDTGTSMVTSDDINVANVSALKVSFWYKPIRLSGSGERFYLQISADGENFVEMGRWSGSHSYQQAVVDNIDVTSASNVKVRFVCDGDSYRDRVFIDEIMIEAM
jgi:hypothetical protein